MQIGVEYCWASTTKKLKNAINKWAKKWLASIWAYWAYLNYNCRK